MDRTAMGRPPLLQGRPLIRMLAELLGIWRAGRRVYRRGCE